MAGERLGSAIAVRSAASRGGRGPSFGFDSVRPLGTLPNKILERGSDSGRIGSPKSAEAAFKSVRSIDPIPNVVPEKGSDFAQPQVVTRTIRFDQPAPVVEQMVTTVKPKPIQLPFLELLIPYVIRGPKVAPVEPLKVQPEAKPQVKPEVSIRPIERVSRPVNPVEQYALALRVKADLARLTGVRVRATALTGSEVAPAAQTQAQPKASTVRTESVTRVSTREVRTEIVNQENSNRMPTAIYESARRSSRQRIVSRPPKLIVDERANKARIASVVAARDRQVNSGQDQNNLRVAQESGVFDSEELGSGVLLKARIKRLDGTQPRTGRDIAAVKGELSLDKIKAIVISHTAVDVGEGREVGKSQYREVIQLPDELFPSVDPLGVLPRKREVVSLESVNTTTSNVFIDERVEEIKPSSESAEISEETVPEVLGKDLNFVQLALDRLRYINQVISLNQSMGQINEPEEREMLLAA